MLCIYIRSYLLCDFIVIKFNSVSEPSQNKSMRYHRANPWLATNTESDKNFIIKEQRNNDSYEAGETANGTEIKFGLCGSLHAGFLGEKEKGVFVAIFRRRLMRRDDETTTERISRRKNPPVRPC